ncbi:hypothetical protein I5N05_07615 [Serratia marcescens]|nr:hypothetical protein [Serratia marcescens]
MDKLREEFEQWFNEEMVLHISASNETVVRLMWKAWKASRASIVVELPEKNDPADMFVSNAYDAEEVAAAIRSIGLSIKGE